jgi:hypothetical protein
MLTGGKDILAAPIAGRKGAAAHYPAISRQNHEKCEWTCRAKWTG